MGGGFLRNQHAGNPGWQSVLGASYDRIGHVVATQGNLVEPLESFRASLAIRERLANADAANAGWQRDLGASYARIGDVLVAQGDLAEALKNFRAWHDIIERLAKADAGNADWQRDLAMSHEKIGDVYSKQENNEEARQAFERALSAYELLMLGNPGDVQSQVLSVLPLWWLAGLDPPKARNYLEASLAILKPLAETNRLDANRLQ